MKQFDFSKEEDPQIDNLRNQYLGNESDGLDQAFVEEVKADSGWFSRVKSKLQNYTGNKQLTEDDLAPVLEDLKQNLMAKNVNTEVAQNISDDVSALLLETRTKKFTTVFATAQQALQQSLQKILSAGGEVDILRDALTAKSRGRPYVITFCGVNGVGKSTNLAKIAYMLKSKGGLSIMIAACDTFRSGAVEQLRRHATCLQVPLFEKGYGKDPAQIAGQAIRYAKDNEIDVVLVDTAGRMQDNEQLMQALAKLVSNNNPDAVLFVGEAIVGNDGVDQLVKFNQALRDFTVDGRGVDGILLTKFDTVDDKVGAAVSMVYAARKPIVYVGTGQKYTHLRKLNIATVLHNLAN